MSRTLPTITRIGLASTVHAVAAGWPHAVAQTPGQMEYERQRREYRQQQEQQRQDDAIRGALVKKFGPPSAVGERPGDHGLLWPVNAAGVQIIDKSTQARCGEFMPIDPPAPGQNILFNGYKSEGCGVTVQARIGRSSLNGPLSDYLSVSLIDDSSFEEIRRAAARFASQATHDTASKFGVLKL